MAALLEELFDNVQTHCINCRNIPNADDEPDSNLHRLVIF
jgi:hypothetical protein